MNDRRMGPLTRAVEPGWWSRRQAKLAPFLLVAPAALLFGLFVVFPIARSVWLSFYDWNGVDPKVWVGLRNYQELFSDPVFYTALFNNIRWLLLFALAPAMGLLLALFLNQNVFGIRLARSLFFMPFVMSPVVVGIVFSWFFNGQFGLFNQVLMWLGAQPISPLEGESSAIFAVIIASLWPQTAYCMILYLTGLVSLRGDLIEVARLHGARGWTLLRDIVLPQLRPVTFIVALVCVVGALRSFDLVLIITQGGPYNSSTVLAYYMYEQTFLSFRYGYGAAIATVLFALMSTCIGVFLWRLLRSERD